MKLIKKTIIIKKINSRFIAGENYSRKKYAGWQENNLSYLSRQLAHSQGLNWVVNLRIRNNYIRCLYILFLSTAPTLYVALPNLEFSASVKLIPFVLMTFFPPSRRSINPIKPLKFFAFLRYPYYVCLIFYVVFDIWFLPQLHRSSCDLTFCLWIDREKI